MGIAHTVGSLSQKAERDVLMQDFVVVESIFFPRLVTELKLNKHGKFMASDFMACLSLALLLMCFQ